MVVVYPILGMLYERTIHPITIRSTLPSAGAGAPLMLILFRYDLGVIALIGIILLIGIVKKYAIMMIDFALEAGRNDGLSPDEAIYRSLPATLSTHHDDQIAALLGSILPILSFGAGAELRRPLGYTIVGGLLLSQWQMLYTTPIVYLYLGRLGGWRNRRLHASIAQRACRAAGWRRLLRRQFGRTDYNETVSSNRWKGIMKHHRSLLASSICLAAALLVTPATV